MSGCDSLFSENTSDQVYKPKKARQCPIFVFGVILANGAGTILHCGDLSSYQGKDIQQAGVDSWRFLMTTC